MAIGIWSAPAEAHRGQTIAYAFHDDDLLSRHQKRGALVYVTDELAPDASAPLVVFLHGLNPQRELHVWLGGRGLDLRRQVDTWVGQGAIQPLLVAAPSQTRGAYASATLWPNFDLQSFVDATDRALTGGPTVDRSKVVVVGHSGAGCNDEGGLASIAAAHQTLVPLAIVAVDTCMDQGMAAALARAPATTAVHVYWQQSSWARPFDAFRLTFETVRPTNSASSDVLEAFAVGSPDPHNAIVPIALERALRSLLPAGRT